MKAMKGQTLIEIMVALAVGIIILSAITTAVLTSLNNVEQSSSKDQSGSYATDGLEIVRKMRDTQITAFRNLSGDYCLASTCTTLSNQQGDVCGKKISTCQENNKGYIREVTISKNATTCRVTPAPTNASLNGTQVTVKVLWKSSQCRNPDDPYCHSSTVQSCLFPIIQ